MSEMPRVRIRRVVSPGAWLGACVTLAALCGTGCTGSPMDDDDDSTTDISPTPTATPTPTPAPTPTPDPYENPGKLALTFAIDTDYMAIMDEDPIGAFYGSIYLASDVTGAGPKPGVSALADVYVEAVDLLNTTPAGGPTAVLFTTDDLPSTRVCILGFQDSDDNTDTSSPDPDDKDPVTLPGDNYFSVVAGESTTVEVFFGLLNP